MTIIHATKMGFSVVGTYLDLAGDIDQLVAEAIAEVHGQAKTAADKVAENNPDCIYGWRLGPISISHTCSRHGLEYTITVVAHSEMSIKITGYNGEIDDEW